MSFRNKWIVFTMVLTFSWDSFSVKISQPKVSSIPFFFIKISHCMNKVMQVWTCALSEGLMHSWGLMLLLSLSLIPDCALMILRLIPGSSWMKSYFTVMHHFLIFLFCFKEWSCKYVWYHIYYSNSIVKTLGN